MQECPCFEMTQGTLKKSQQLHVGVEGRVSWLGRLVDAGTWVREADRWVTSTLLTGRKEEAATRPARDSVQVTTTSAFSAALAPVSVPTHFHAHISDAS